MKNNLGAIILAAGKGKRMNSRKINKVVMPLADKPMILHAVELLEASGVKNIVVVVGFAKESVINIIGKRALFAVQRKRLGTAHAVSCGLKELPEDTENVVVLNGDDSAFYSKDIIKKLIEKHCRENDSFTFLTLDQENPLGLGRIVRDINGKLISVIEEKDASTSQRAIKEINPACYVFKTDFLKKYLPKVKKSPVTGEYYLTSLIDIGIKNNEKINTLRGGRLAWRGVNTKEELAEAETLINKLK